MDAIGGPEDGEGIGWSKKQISAVVPSWVRTCDDWTTHYNASAAAMLGRQEAVVKSCIMDAARRAAQDPVAGSQWWLRGGEVEGRKFETRRQLSTGRVGFPA